MCCVFSNLETDVQFLFTEDDFRASERLPVMPVLVSKTSRIASQIILEVVPITVNEARISNLPLPRNIPLDDSQSPPYAGEIIAV